MTQEIIAINENTWRIEDGFVRFFLLTGSEKALLIDTGASCPNARELAERLTSLPLSVLYTHGDGDHTSGSASFDSCMMHPADYENCHMAEKFPMCRCQPIRDGEILDLGSRKLEIITIPGHTYGSVAILDTESGMLFSGDSVQSGTVFLFGPHRDIPHFEESLDKLIAMQHRFTVICPSHGEPVLPGNYAETVKAAWKQVCSGAVAPVPETLHGFQVDHYICNGCGFFCQPKSE